MTITAYYLKMYFPRRWFRPSMCTRGEVRLSTAALRNDQPRGKPCVLMSKVAVLMWLCLPTAVLAAPVPEQPCKASFRNFVVDREPKGYPVNKATLTVIGAGACFSKDGNYSASPGLGHFDAVISIKSTLIDVYDNVTREHSTARTTTSISVSRERKLAVLFNNYLGLNIELPIELQGSRVTIKLTQPPKKILGPSAPPLYELRMGSELTIDYPK